MKSYTTYLFDLDGTITDTSVVWLDLFRDLLIQFDVMPPDDQTLALHTHDWRQMLKLGLPKDHLEDFIVRAHILAQERLPKAKLHTGAYETLTKLKKQGKELAVFSSMDRQLFAPAMRYHKLNTLVSVAVAGNDVVHRKPHPAGIIKALEALDVAEEQYTNAVYIGDKDTDIQTAHNAGIDSIIYYPPSHQRIYDHAKFKQHKPEYIITQWQELLSV